MKLESKHIKISEIVGRAKNGTPILYVQTHGGLHCIFGNNNGKIEVLSAMPHLGMCYWLAQKKQPDAAWDQEKVMELQNA